MTQYNELAQDLKYVRHAVEARNRPPRAGTGHLIIWTLYCLICIPTYDFVPAHGGQINLVGWLIAAVASGIYGRRESIRSGQHDRAQAARNMLHWYGGIILMLVALYGLDWVRAGMSPSLAGQLSVILVGFLYFTAGVHMPDVYFMRWAGPIIIVAGVSIGLVPHYRWTVMALIFAACLTAPLLFSRIPAEQS